MITFAIDFESNIYGWSHAYGATHTIQAENLEAARAWAKAYITTCNERDNVAIGRIVEAA